jgi:hypothetical protein
LHGGGSPQKEHKNGTKLSIRSGRWEARLYRRPGRPHI